MSSCPITGAFVGPSCATHGCMFNKDGMCAHAEVSGIEGDVNEVSGLYGVTVEAVNVRVQDIQIALVASRWFEHLTGRSILSGRAKDFLEAMDTRQEKSFREWNKSSFSFPQIIASLNQVRQGL